MDNLWALLHKCALLASASALARKLVVVISIACAKRLECESPLSLCYEGSLALNTSTDLGI